MVSFLLVVDESNIGSYALWVMTIYSSSELLLSLVYSIFRKLRQNFLFECNMILLIGTMFISKHKVSKS